MKILITSLGVGDKNRGYSKANYQIGDKVYKDKEFIAQALADYLEIDKMFIIGTQASIWDSLYCNFGGTDEDFQLELMSLQEKKLLDENTLNKISTQIDNHRRKSGSQCFLIDYGVCEQELWSNFSKYLQLAEKVSDGDELYIDITHSFRSLSLMSFMMVQFIEQIRDKNIKVKAIYYGMNEYAKENGGITPIVDLSILYEFSRWSKAIELFKRYGNASMLFELMNDEDIEKETKNIFRHFNNNISMGNMGAIKEAVGIISRRVESIKNSSNSIAKFLAPDIESFVARFVNKTVDSDFQLELAMWFCEVKNYALSYMTLMEAIITKICELDALKIKDQKDREKAKKSIPKHSPNLYNDVYSRIRTIRNSIAHDVDRSNSAINDINNLPKYLETTKKIFSTLK